MSPAVARPVDIFAATQIEGFQVIRRVGRGGMGEVFEARRTGPGGFRRAVALKRLVGDDAVCGVSVQRFLAEARIPASQHHPNVLEIHDVVAADSGYVLVMELLTGVTLDALVRAAAAAGGLPVDELCAIADQALAGLAYIHAARGEDGRPLGLIHRDVTTNNVVVTELGEVDRQARLAARVRAMPDRADDGVDGSSDGADGAEGTKRADAGMDVDPIAPGVSGVPPADRLDREVPETPRCRCLAIAWRTRRRARSGSSRCVATCSIRSRALQTSRSHPHDLTAPSDRGVDPPSMAIVEVAADGTTTTCSELTHAAFHGDMAMLGWAGSTPIT